MDSKARAEKIILRYNESDSPKLAELIAAEIHDAVNAAVKEAREQDFKQGLTGALVMAEISEEIRKAKGREAIEQLKSDSFSQGAEFMREKAAKVCEDEWLPDSTMRDLCQATGQFLAEAIRSLPTSCCACCPDGNPTKCNRGVACSKHGEAKPKSDSKAGEKA